MASSKGVPDAIHPRVRRSVQHGRGSHAAAVIALAMLAACSIDDRKLGFVTGAGGGSPGPDGGMAATGAVALRVVPSTLDLGSITQGFATQARLRLQNAGSEQLGLPAVAWGANSDPDLTLVQNQCFGEVAAGGECELRVQLVPSRADELRGTLEISSAPAPTVMVPIVARGLVPGDLTLVPAAGSFEDFGGVHVGEVVEGSLSVTNSGAAASGPLSFLFNRPELAPAAGSQGCVSGETDLASGASCDLRVTFSPTERGPVEAVASVTSSGAGSASLSLRGRGLVPGVLAASATTLDFGGVVPGDAASLNVTVENQGDEALTLSGVALEPADVGVFAIADSNCGEGIVLEAGQTCRVQIAFRPVQEGVVAVGSLLLQTSGGGQSQSVALQGQGLTRGNLVVEAVTAGEEDFGPVLLGASLDRVFRISNPSMQESGPITLQANNGFTLEPTVEEGACEPEVTALATGGSCTVHVSFSPSTRGALEGSLTVNSQLAGAKSLTLKGTGIAPALLATDTGAATEGVVDFGRVTTGSSGQQTITLSNGGDQEMPPPRLEVTSTAADQAAAFSYVSGCAAALGPEQKCDVTVTFAPSLAGPHAATLEIVTEPGGRASLLMVGEAREPGRLVLTAGETAGEDFGDVAVGASLARSFTLTNPGGVASGVLTIRADDSQFVVDSGACGQVTAGLAEGESCALQVSFTPTTNVQTEARLSVLSPAAGETGIAVKGRGRSPGVLAATTTERDLGRANIGEPSGLANVFTWTVNNPGDLPSGVLTVANTNPADFDVSEDTCDGKPIAGGGSCIVTTVFAPDVAGSRTGGITVADPATTQSVTLTVAGIGVRLGELGDTCLVGTDCAGGVCSGGVCCNQACDGTCQTCGTGQCLQQTNQEACGNGSGVCFGLNQCRLPAGGACTTDTDCGGTLVCKACRLGGRQCTAPDGCCGGCNSPFECVGGSCDCPFQNDGLQQLNCGGGVCAANRTGACCTSSPPAGCNCDPADNLCKECLTASQCPAGATGTVPSCTGQQCQYSCDASLGFRDCNGRCIGPSQCCGNADCNSLCQQCNTTTNSCDSFAPGVQGRCAPGEVCNDALQCITLPGLGSACSGECAQGTCFQSICCEAACGDGGCDSQGRCPVCFDTLSAHPLSAGDCQSGNGTARYCVPAGSADDFTVRAQAACQACEGGACSLKLCVGFDGTTEATGFALTSEPRHVWVTSPGICNGQLISPGEAYFDPVGRVTFTY